MSLNNGLLLFDFPEPNINDWKENIGFRGMLECWEKENNTIYIDVDEDCESPDSCLDINNWETRIENIDGSVDFLCFGTFDECKQAAIGFMKLN